MKYRAFILLTLFVLSASGVSASGSEFDIERIHTILDTRSWHYGYDHATRLTSATLGTLSPSSTSELETILAQHRWQYDPGDNRIATQKDSQGRIPSTFNHLNQLLTQGSGPTRIAGIIDEPGTVTINGEEAKMRNETEFEAYLNLPAGLHQIDIEATDFSDFSDNTATQSYEITIANEPEEHFEYDLNGNLVERISAAGTTAYDWDGFDRLIAIHHPDGTSTHFTYDGLSRRVAITQKGDHANITQERKFLWHGLTIAEERSGVDGTTVEKRFYPNGVELVTGPDAGTYTYRTDHLGSIREVVNSSGSLTGRYDYSAWGEVSGVPISFITVGDPVYGSFDLDFKYTGHFYHAASGLHLASFRAYDAAFGRWISRDPIQEQGGLNLYGYVENDPTNLVDLDGLSPQPARQIMHPAGGGGGGGGGIGALGAARGAGTGFGSIGRCSPRNVAPAQARVPNAPHRVTNPKHHPNSKSPEPKNVDELWKKSITDPKTGVRWSKDSDGVIHRFSRPSNGECHWNGSTAGPRPIRLQDIPNEILKLLQ